MTKLSDHFSGANNIQDAAEFVSSLLNELKTQSFQELCSRADNERVTLETPTGNCRIAIVKTIPAKGIVRIVVENTILAPWLLGKMGFGSRSSVGFERTSEGEVRDLTESGFVLPPTKEVDIEEHVANVGEYLNSLLHQLKEEPFDSLVTRTDQMYILLHSPSGDRHIGLWREAQEEGRVRLVIQCYTTVPGVVGKLGIGSAFAMGFEKSRVGEVRELADEEMSEFY